MAAPVGRLPRYRSPGKRIPRLHFDSAFKNRRFGRALFTLQIAAITARGPRLDALRKLYQHSRGSGVRLEITARKSEDSDGVD